MANATQQNVFNVQLTRSQLELLDKLLDQELYALEQGYSDHNSRLLKRTSLAIWEHLKPTPEEKQQRLQSWVSAIYGSKSPGVLLPKDAAC